MIELTFLGTSSMVPTKERNQSAIFISYDTHGILVDCGEGTQRQFKFAGIPLTKITKILITHWHSDHTLGLPGLLQSLSASEYGRTLEIYGPKGIKERLEHMYRAFLMDRLIEMKITEIKEGTFFENGEFKLEAKLLDHGIPCYAYAFVEKDKRRIDMARVKKLGMKEGPLLGKLQRGETVEVKGKKISPDDVSSVQEGKKVAIISDTLLCDSCYEIAQDADLLISESTYSAAMEEKAEGYNHMTSKQAALVASKSNVKRLILTHFSARYKSTLELNDDARDYFENTECAFDLMKVKL
ncbi:ribonuclease Z [Candidatus Woesearchaeota archaeon]|nr:ribonuclease Z [Candidatus Woesearchaeota archaeon]